jgi:formylglycine-generating enzyme required for sulfatase activity
MIFVLGIASAQDAQFSPKPSQIPGPATSADFQKWLADVKHWRMERRIRIGYDASEYDRLELEWTQSSFIQPQMMIHERYFYDPVAGHYTVDRYLDDLEKRYGGIDSVLVWQSYPNIGIDDRNQYDMARDMPGGIDGLQQMVTDFHRRGVRVLFPVMVWDQGTRDEGVPNWIATARLMAQIGADGVNGDTLDEVPLAFRVASDETHHPLAFQPENLTIDEGLLWNNLSWGYWDYSFIPTVGIYKWLESRHMVNICRRWARDKTDDLQHAFFNGVGYESWENIWGIWNQITPRDAEALRRIATIERAMAPMLVSADWEPHTPTLQYGVFASKFPGRDRTLWTLVNRNEYNVRGQQIKVPYPPEGRPCFDLWHGVSLTPVAVDSQERSAVLSFDIEAHGFGAVLCTEGPPGVPPLGMKTEPDPNVAKLMAKMRDLAMTPLASYSHEWKFLPQRIVEIAPTQPAATAPSGMVPIPGATFEFRVSGIEIEGENDIAVDVQYPWDHAPRRHHLQTLKIKPLYIDKFPVSNAEFKRFLDAAHYHPKSGHNFLRDWKNNTYPDGWANKPVTWVALDDARAYAQWAGKRLPHEWEWQYAAQGTDGRLYPWGNEWNASAVPPTDKGRVMREPTDVNAYPQGASPFGVMDLVGNVWQWAEEFTDEHTRAAILRGGELLPTARLDVVLPAGLQVERARQVPAYGPQPGPVGDRGVPVRGGCGVNGPPGSLKLEGSITGD